MRRFSIRSQCVCYIIGILLSIFLPIVPSSVQDVHGASVTLAWDPNPDANLAGYKVYYGCASGSYSFMVDAGNRTSLMISGLEDGKTYYFTATAYGTAGEESDMSDEIRYDAPRPDSHLLSPAKAPGDPASYTIQASAGPNGSISSSGNIAVSRGSSKTFIIRPNRGYRICRVIIDGVSMNYVTSHTFTHINTNHTIRAEFESIRNKTKKTDMTPSNPSH
jgi:hypothetical protein